MRFLKYALAAAGALLFVAAAFVAYFVLTFDVRDYEPRIVALVKEKTGRTLTIRAQTRLAVWPDLGVTFGPASLSERDSDAVFAEVANARIVAKLKPLLDKQLVADELHLEGASVRIVRRADGGLNIDDLLRGEGATAAFDIAKVRVERSSLAYENLAAGARHEITDLDVVTGRLASGVTAPVTLSFKARDAAATYAVAAGVQGRLAFDLTQRTYRLEAATARVDGTIAGTSGVAAKLDVGTLDLSRGGMGVEAVAVDARAADWHARVKAPRLDFREGSVRAENAAFDVDVERDGRNVSASGVAAVSAAPAARSVELSDIRTKFAATGAALPKRGIEGVVSGSASVDVRASRAHAAFSGTVLGSKIKGKLAITDLASRSYTFAVDVDVVDLDRLSASSGSAGKSGEPFDVASLSALRGEGVVRIGSLTSAGVVAKNVQLAVRP